MPNYEFCGQSGDCNYKCLGVIDKPKTGLTNKVRKLATGEIESLRALPGATSRDPELAERLLREIRVQARLSHPNILEFHDAFEIDGRLVMTTEFVDAPTLAELWKRDFLIRRGVIRLATGHRVSSKLLTNVILAANLLATCHGPNVAKISNG